MDTEKQQIWNRDWTSRTCFYFELVIPDKIQRQGSERQGLFCNAACCKATHMYRAHCKITSGQSMSQVQLGSSNFDSDRGDKLTAPAAYLRIVWLDTFKECNASDSSDLQVRSFLHLLTTITAGHSRAAQGQELCTCFILLQVQSCKAFSRCSIFVHPWSDNSFNSFSINAPFSALRGLLTAICEDSRLIPQMQSTSDSLMWNWSLAGKDADYHEAKLLCRSLRR